MLLKRYLTFAAIAVVLAIAGNYLYKSRSAKPEAVQQPINTNQYLETEVRKRLSESGVLKEGDNVLVSAHDGTVTLTGTVGADWKRQSAGNIASSTPAVLEVKNLITVPEAAPVPQQVWKSDSPTTPQTAATKRPRRVYVDPTARAQELVAQGDYYVAQKNYRAAVKAYQAALEYDGTNYAARSGLQEAQRMR
ncbi:MAG: BON domain-containing protein [Acidobacteriales bacterium]|nr:BON domain-containing protein [Terriglobales bacterium]